jgi:hypothetical protein
LLLEDSLVAAAGLIVGALGALLVAALGSLVVRWVRHLL